MCRRIHLNHYRITALILPLLAAAPAYADRGDQYLLGKIGFMSIQLNDADRLISLGGIYGFGLTPRVSLEAEANFGVSGGEYTQKDSAGAVVQTGDYRVSTLAGYGVFRHLMSGPVFAKVKIGGLYENVKRTGKVSSETSTGFGVAGGLGVGWQIGPATTIEGELTGIDQDIIFYSVGFNAAFK